MQKKKKQTKTSQPQKNCKKRKLKIGREMIKPEICTYQIYG